MKKTKLLLVVLSAAALAAGGALAGCNNGQHTHTYSNDWSKGADGHWHVATCDDLKEGDKDYKKDFAAHEWGNDDECDVCGYVKDHVSKVTLNETELKLGIGNVEADLQRLRAAERLRGNRIIRASLR